MAECHPDVVFIHEDHPGHGSTMLWSKRKGCYVSEYGCYTAGMVAEAIGTTFEYVGQEQLAFKIEV